MTDWLAYFNRYAETSLTGAPAELAAFYASGFVAAGPRGSYGALNDEKFEAWLAGVQAFNRQVGMRSMRALEAIEEASLGPSHGLVRVRWGARFAKTGEREIEFDISYVLHLGEPGPRIVAYVSHEDQEEAMRRQGLLEEPEPRRG